MNIAEILDALAQSDDEKKELNERFKDILDEVPSVIVDNPVTVKPRGVVVWTHAMTTREDANEIVRKNDPLLVIAEKQIEDLPCYVCPSSYRAWLKICKKKLDSFSGLKKIVVTGSCGKTTVKDLIYAVLSEEAVSLKNFKSVNGWRGIALAVMGAPEGLKYYVTEMGLSKPNNAFVPLSEAVEPDICVITNIGDAHFENFKSKEQILEQKLLCAKAMPEETGCLILNYDDPIIMSHEYRHKVITVSLNNDKADYYAKDINLENGISFIAVCKDREIPIQMNIYGEHNVFNAMVAVTIGDMMGIKDESIQNALSSYQTEGMRQNVMDGTAANGTHQKLIVDCFNASSGSMMSALEVLKSMKNPEKTRKIAVLGDMVSAGSLSEDAHTEVGRTVVEMGFDVCVGFGEKIKYATDYVQENGSAVSRYFNDVQECADYLNGLVAEGDVVLFKGSRALKMEDIIAKVYNLKLKI